MSNPFLQAQAQAQAQAYMYPLPLASSAPIAFPASIFPPGFSPGTYDLTGQDDIVTLSDVYNNYWKTVLFEPFWVRLGISGLGTINDTTIRVLISRGTDPTDMSLKIPFYRTVVFLKFYFIYLQQIYYDWSLQFQPILFQDFLTDTLQYMNPNTNTLEYIPYNNYDEYLSTWLKFLHTKINEFYQTIIDFNDLDKTFLPWLGIAMFYVAPFAKTEDGCIDLNGIVGTCSVANPPFISVYPDANKTEYINVIASIVELNPDVRNAFESILPFIGVDAIPRLNANGNPIDVINYLISESDQDIDNLGKVIRQQLNGIFDIQQNIKPFEIKNLCVKSDNSIYILKMQVLKSIMDVIQDNFELVLRDISRFFFANARLDLIRLGYFGIKYTNADRKIKVFYIEYIDNAKISVNIDTLTQKQLLDFISSDIRYKTFFENLILKTLMEQIVKQGTMNDFEIHVSIDMYGTRTKNASTVNKYHQDATAECPTDFFTLTYLLKHPVTNIYDRGLRIKGPTVITATDLHNPDIERNQVTLVLEHGSTIGIDNTLVLHSTSDDFVRMPLICDMVGKIKDQVEFQNVLTGTPNILTMKSKSKSGRMNAQTRQYYDELATCQRSVDRTFVRTWFIPSFPMDPNFRFFPIYEIPLTAQMYQDIATYLSSVHCVGGQGEPDVILEMASEYSVGGIKKYKKYNRTMKQKGGKKTMKGKNSRKRVKKGKKTIKMKKITKYKITNYKITNYKKRN
jgi:hypothetical protein